MEAQRDRKTGIIRHEYGTVNPKVARRMIEESGIVIRCSSDNSEDEKTVYYDVSFRKEAMSIVSTSTRVIIFGKDEPTMFLLADYISRERWEYDNSNKNDFMPKR